MLCETFPSPSKEGWESMSGLLHLLHSCFAWPKPCPSPPPCLQRTEESIHILLFGSGQPWLQEQPFPKHQVLVPPTHAFQAHFHTELVVSSRSPAGRCETHPCVGELAHAARTPGTGSPALQAEACLWQGSLCVSAHEGLCVFKTPRKGR